MGHQLNHCSNSSARGCVQFRSPVYVPTFYADFPPRVTYDHCYILVSSYPHSLINTAIAGGLLFLHSRWGRSWDWSPPFKAWPLVTVFFLVSNVFLVVVPLVPPASGYSPFEHLPYFVSPFYPWTRFQCANN